MQRIGTSRSRSALRTSKRTRVLDSEKRSQRVVNFHHRDLKSVDNPIEENYENKKDKIDVHAGFYRYLFRIRKDTGTRKYDEIRTVVHGYGSKLIGDYSLVITGHSLGAALSTVFGLFASSDERFTARGPIRMYTFGSPYVGGKMFLEAFRHQEYSRKIQYVRLHNVRDGGKFHSFGSV